MDLSQINSNEIQDIKKTLSKLNEKIDGIAKTINSRIDNNNNFHLQNHNETANKINNLEEKDNKPIQDMSKQLEAVRAQNCLKQIEIDKIWSTLSLMHLGMDHLSLFRKDIDNVALYCKKNEDDINKCYSIISDVNLQINKIQSSINSQMHSNNKIFDIYGKNIDRLDLLIIDLKYKLDEINSEMQRMFDMQEIGFSKALDLQRQIQNDNINKKIAAIPKPVIPKCEVPKETEEAIKIIKLNFDNLLPRINKIEIQLMKMEKNKS